MLSAELIHSGCLTIFGIPGSVITGSVTKPDSHSKLTAYQSIYTLPIESTYFPELCHDIVRGTIKFLPTFVV